MSDAITLSLISHTNVGKTTLARTLLRRDVGQVLDQAHVTDENTAYELMRSNDGELVLWDTPGFGDSVRLLRSLKPHDNPFLWFFRQTWDRFTDRPLWCAQQAAINVRNEADVVLYLVNDSEEPDAAGYVEPELELLSWMDRPIILLLNQSGEASYAPRQLESRMTLWRQHCMRWPKVVDVVALDAFSRCWVQEGFLFERILEHLPTPSQPLMQQLIDAWHDRDMDIFQQAVKAMAEVLAEAATERENLPVRRGLSTPRRKADRQKGMEVLARRLERSSERLMGDLLRLYGLEGRSGEQLQTEIEAFWVRGELLETEKSALLGGVVSGAVGGLAADLMAGGLTFGGGVVAGAILGALGGAGLAGGYRMLSGEKTPAVAWSSGFLDELCEQLMLRYLAVAHFGRGRGEFKKEEAHIRWREVVERRLRHRLDTLQDLWKDAQKLDEAYLAERLEPIVADLLVDILRSLYPQSRLTPKAD